MAASAVKSTQEILQQVLSELFSALAVVATPAAGISNPSDIWSYAAASGGITNTTGVTFKAAAGAALRNYVKSVQLANGAAAVNTDVQIRDGVSGTVLWRGFAKLSSEQMTIVFDPPLRGSVNTLLEVACGTTASITYFNAQGFVAT